MSGMLAMPRLPAVSATVCPGRMRPAQVEPFQGRGDGAGHVFDARPLEALAEADDVRISHGWTPI